MSNKKKQIKKRSQQQAKKQPRKASKSKLDINLFLWIGGIVLLTALLYYPVSGFDFVNWDDDRYVLDNPYIQELSWANIKYYFTNFYFLMYLPITLLTYAIDYKIGGGLTPGVFHITSLIFHLLNSALVFIVIRKIFTQLNLKAKDIGAAITAILFAITPMHIESVVWIAERKDVVYTFFYLLSVLCYLKYFEQKTLKTYTLALVFFLLSIISKAQAMTLPVVLILLDYVLKRDYLNKKALIEKIPFFVISIVFGIIAIFGTRSEGESANTAYTFIEKLVYASYGFTTYVIKLFVPYKLSVIYPYPEAANHEIPFLYWLYLLPSVGVVSLIALFYKRKPIIAFGVAFFAANIVIVLQIFAYHNFIMADRYSYVSSIGLFFIVAYFVAKLFENKPKLKTPILVAAAIYFAFLFMYGRNRLFDWKDSITLWQDVKNKYPQVLISYYNGANAKAEIGDKHASKNDQQNAIKLYKDAITDYDQAISMKADYVGALSNRGITHAKLGNVKNALADFNEVVKIDSVYNNVYSNRGNAKVMLGDIQGAISDYSKAIAINPEYLDAIFNRGMAYVNIGQWQAALKDFNRLIELKPNYNKAHYYRGMCYSNTKDYQKAINDYNISLQYNQNNLDAWYNRGVTYMLDGNNEAAIKDFDVVIRTSPNIGLPYYQRGLAKAKLGKLNEACPDLQKSLSLGIQAANEQLKLYCN